MTATLSSRVALVTGASRGIGRAIEIALAGAGADVVVVVMLAGNAYKTGQTVQVNGGMHFN